MKFIKNKTNYCFTIWNTSLSLIEGNYCIQSKLPFLGFYNFYQGNNCPKFRNLYLISLFAYFISILAALPLFMIYVIYFIGRALHFVAKFLLIISYLLMQMPNSAKFELKELFEVWGKDF